MAARNRLPPWHEQLRLANGREVLIRPIRADDAAPLQASLSLLQPDEVRQRMLPAPGAGTLQRLTQPQPRTEFALVAAEPLPPGEALVGALARAAVVPGTREAEFTVLVSQYVAGMGLGRHLVRRLVRWARGKKLDRMSGEVSDGNEPMLSLLESLGFRRERSDTPGMVRAVLDFVPAAA